MANLFNITSISDTFLVTDFFLIRRLNALHEGTSGGGREGGTEAAVLMKY